LKSPARITLPVRFVRTWSERWWSRKPHDRYCRRAFAAGAQRCRRRQACDWIEDLMARNDAQDWGHTHD
jgi:hypothetical protein